MLFALAAVAAAVTPAPSVRAERRAHASVRIVRAARIDFGERPRSDGDAMLRETLVRERDGALKPALLLEFS